jgi:hypothetical protein
MGGTIHKVNSGKVERLTRTQVIIRNEHGNVQRFSRATGAAIPQVDWLCPEYMRKSETPSGEPTASKTEIANAKFKSHLRAHLEKPIAKTPPQDFSDLDGIFEPAAPDLMAALISAMSIIPNPDDVEDGRTDGLDEYQKLWMREIHKKAKAAITKATNPARYSVGQ